MLSAATGIMGTGGQAGADGGGRSAAGEVPETIEGIRPDLLDPDDFTAIV